MKTTAALTPLLCALLLQCSDPAPDPQCSVDCNDGGTGSYDAATEPACTVDCDGRGYDAKSYELVGHFDWARSRLVATERVTIVKTSVSDTVELDATVDVMGVHTADGAASLPFTVSGALLHVDVSSLRGGDGTMSFTIDYEASTSDALVASASRDDDPVTARVVYTDSEPFGGMKWLPANHRPSDRAAWKVELTVGATEDVIGNGTRAKDEMSTGLHVVRYEMNDPIPTYTMAFAAGELEHQDRTAGRVPISVWYRRGLVLDPNETLDLVADAMGAYEKLLGPYPWPRYSVVLLPEFSGGMENTTVTFTSEASGQANPGQNLQAHELGHHWYGDWVTVATFDDVWIKEGMATLLAAESTRAARDTEGKGRFFGDNFDFTSTDAIRDRSLVGIAKYTSGPYQRAAWLLSQIRVRVGETAFWRSLRKVLAEHALGFIDGESFLRSFDLDEETVQKALRALDEKRVPAVAIATAASQGGTAVTLTLTDPGETMIAPTVVTVVDAQGQASSSMLVPDAPLTVTVPTGGYIAPDENDVHPEWWESFTTNSTEYAALTRLLFPASDAARAAFASRTAGHQERALYAVLNFTGNLPVTPSAFPDFHVALDSAVSQHWAELAGCFTFRSSMNAQWPGVLGPILAAPSQTTWSTWFAACQTALPTQTFGGEFANLATSLDAHDASRFVYLSGYDYGAVATFSALSTVAVQGPSLQLREQALTRLSYQAASNYGYTAVPANQQTIWKDFFRARLTDAKSVARFLMVWRGVVGLKDDSALTIAGRELHTVALSEDEQRQVVCDAYKISQSIRADAWTEFQQAAQPWDTLGAAARTALMSAGTGCSP